MHVLISSLVSLYLCISVCVCVCLVESYTREAGVRTLERRIGALCRAVAVKVAEHQHKLDISRPSTGQLAADQEGSVQDAGKQEPESAETVDIMNVSKLTIPPKLPIVIDVAAVEDILGVSIHSRT